MMTIRPMNNHVLIKPLEADEKTAGGIVLPDTAKDSPQEAKVIAMARDATEQVAVGDRVIYQKHSGTEVKLEGEDYVLISSDDLLAKYLAVDKIPD